MTVRPGALIYRNYGRVRKTISLPGATFYRRTRLSIRIESSNGRLPLVAPSIEDLDRIVRELETEGCREVGPPPRIRRRLARRATVRRLLHLPEWA